MRNILAKYTLQILSTSEYEDEIIPIYTDFMTCFSRFDVVRINWYQFIARSILNDILNNVI